MSTQSPFSHPIPYGKPLAGKYDKRRNNNTPENFRAKNTKPGPKPKWAKYANRALSTTYLKEIDAIKTPTQMFQDAIDCKNYELAWKIRESVENRVAGKPFVAENPNGNGKLKAADAHLNVAINNLTVNNTSKSKKKQVVLDSQAISTQSAGDLPVLPVASSDASAGIQEPIQAAKNPPDGHGI